MNKVTLETIADAIAPAGLIVRGGVHAEPADAVPPIPGGRATETVVLIGNAGSTMWDAFQSSNTDSTLKDPLDSWLTPQIADVAASAGAHPIFPNEGPPFVPIQDWARRSEPVHRSPIGLMIHPLFGLWHVYRAAFCFAEYLELPPRANIASPCEACETKPCLKVCPADAFGPTSFDTAACLTHVQGIDGGTCRDGGCMARRACPVGRQYLYPRPSQAFHTSAFMRSAKHRFGTPQ